MKKHDSFIVAIEGIDGSGKHTICQELCKLINETNHDYGLKHNNNNLDKCDVLSFPDYDSLIGKGIKKLLQSGYKGDALPLLFAGERHTRRISDSVTNMFIFDRYYMSNFAYHYDGTLERLFWLESLEDKSYVCDMVFILDVDQNTSNERRPERRDNIELDLDYLGKVRYNYLKLANTYGWIVVNGTGSIESVSRVIYNHILTSNNGLTKFSN